MQLLSNLSTIDSKDYSDNANIGYNQKLDELLISNQNYAYSYLYSFKSGYWHKIDESFRVLIDSYPKLIVLREDSSNNGVFDMSTEQFGADVSTLIVTRPCKIDNDVNFTMLNRAIQRCEIETSASTYAGFYVFGSNDLQTWQLLQGSDKKTNRVTDIFCTRSHLKVKYFESKIVKLLRQFSIYLVELILIG